MASNLFNERRREFVPKAATGKLIGEEYISWNQDLLEEVEY